MKPDVTAHEPMGSIGLVTPLTRKARAWIAENVVGETSWLGASLAVEARYFAPLVEGMAADGLAVQIT